MSAPGIGATAASLFLASVNKLRVGTRSICACVLGFALFLTLFAFSHSFVLSIVALTMVGFCQLGARALSNTVIQTDTPQNLLGRVLSLFFMDRGLWSLGSLIIGGSAAVMSIEWTFCHVRVGMHYRCERLVGVEPSTPCRSDTLNERWRKIIVAEFAGYSLVREQLGD
jgi:hypothetical protein